MLIWSVFIVFTNKYEEEERLRKQWKGVGIAAIAMLAFGNVAFAANETKTGIVQKNDVNIRSEASVDSKVVGVLNENTKIAITGSKDNFYEISWEGQTAYIAGNYVSVSTSETNQTGTIAAKYVILRSEATTESKKITKLDKNETVSIQGEKNGFYQVNTAQGAGYVSKEYVDVKAGAIDSKTTSMSEMDQKKVLNSVVPEAADTPANTALNVVDIKSMETVDATIQAQPAAPVPLASTISTAPEPNTVSSAIAQEDANALFLMMEEEADTGVVFDLGDPKTVEYQVEVDTYTEEELDIIARLIHAEGNTSSESLEAIASVFYNRLISNKFPDTVEGVAFQKSQFTVTRNRDKFDNIQPSPAAKEAVQKVFVRGTITLPAEIMYFKSTSLSQSWGSRVYYKTIDGNMFYS